MFFVLALATLGLSFLMQRRNYDKWVWRLRWATLILMIISTSALFIMDRWPRPSVTYVLATVAMSSSTGQFSDVEKEALRGWASRVGQIGSEDVPPHLVITRTERDPLVAKIVGMWCIPENYSEVAVVVPAEAEPKKTSATSAAAPVGNAVAPVANAVAPTGTVGETAVSNIIVPDQSGAAKK
jgi:hypothetical protein